MPPTENYNDILDSDYYHNDDVSTTGKPRPIPVGVSDTIKSGERVQIPFGGHSSTALNAVNFVKVNREAVADRNLAWMRERIVNEKFYQEKEAQKARAGAMVAALLLTAVI